MASHFDIISYSVLLVCLRVHCWLSPPLYVHAAPLSSAAPSVPSSPSSQSGAFTVAEGKPTVPQNEEGEKCVCMRACTVMHVCAHALQWHHREFVYALQL